MLPFRSAFGETLKDGVNIVQNIGLLQLPNESLATPIHCILSMKVPFTGSYIFNWALLSPLSFIFTIPSFSPFIFFPSFYTSKGNSLLAIQVSFW